MAGWAAVQRVAKGVNAANDTVGSGDGWAKPTAGNLLVVSANSDATVTITNAGGTWTGGPSVVDGNGAYLWYKFSNGTETSITCTPSVSDTITVTVCEYSGIAAFPFDAQNSSTIASSPGASTTATSVTTAADGDLIIAVAAAHVGSGSAGANPAGPVWTNGFNNVLSVNTGGGNGVTDCYTFYAELTAGAPGSYSTSCSWTPGTVGDRQQLMIAFKAATGPQVVEVGTTSYVSANTATVNSGTFTPADDCLLVAYCGMGNGTGGAISTGTVTDTLGGTWKRLASDVATNGGIAEIYCRDVVGTGASMSVTYDPGGTGASGNNIIVKQYIGAKPSAQQPGATALNAGGSAYSKAIVTTTVGSLVAGALGRATNAVTLTANASTTLFGQISGSAGDVSALFRASALTTTPGSTTLGFTNAASVANYIALAEILPVTPTDTGSYIETFWPGGGMIGPPQVFQFMQDPRSDDLGSVPAVLSAVIGQVVDTETAQPIGRLKQLAIGQAVETDTAQPITRRVARAVGQVSEVDTAQAIANRIHTRLIGQTTETDTAQVVGRLAHVKAIGQVSEVDTAQTLTRRKSRTLGQTSEVDTSQPIGRLAHTKTLGQVSETDTAQHMGASRSKTVGQASEVDTAQALASRLKRRTLGQVSETDTAQAMSAIKGRNVVVGQVSETDTAQPIIGRKARTLGLVSETDTAQALTRRKARALGQVSEADTAQSLLRRKAMAIGLATENDSASPIARVKRRAIGLASETDTAFTLAGRLKRRTLGQVAELDIAHPFSGFNTKTIGQVAEADSALALTRRKARALGQVAETDVAQALGGRRKLKAIGIASEVATAQPLTRRRSRLLGIATSVATALGLTRRRSWSIGQPFEVDTAQPVTTPSTTNLVRPADVIYDTGRLLKQVDIVSADAVVDDVGRGTGTALLDRPITTVDVGRT